MILTGYASTVTVLNAQTQQKIQFLDSNSKRPISWLSFQYGSQRGLSDEQGYIYMIYKEGLSLQLSHISYGQWVMTDNQVRESLKQQKSFKEPSEIHLHPVTIIALRHHLDDQHIMNLDYHDMLAHDGGAILNQTPGINSIRKSGSYGFDPVLRGFKYDQLNIVIDGAQTAHAACPNRMDPPTSQIAPNMMESVEILKGPHALRFGSSLGGTINFISKKNKFSETTDAFGRLSGSYEQNGNVLRQEGMAGIRGKGYDLNVFASWSQGNDYQDGENNEVPADFKRGSLGMTLGLKLSENQQLTLSATRNIARDTDFPALPMDLREDDTWMLNARHIMHFNKSSLQSWNTTVYGTWVDHLMDNGLKRLNPRMLNAETRAQTRTYGGRTEGTWKFSQSKLYVGGDLKFEEAEGIRTRDFLIGPNAGKTFQDNAWQDSRIRKSGLFAEYHLYAAQFHWIFSGRLELNEAQLGDMQPEFSQVNNEEKITQVNPNFSVGSIHQLNQDVSLGLFLGRAQRSGGLMERFINFFPVGQDPFELVGNPSLKPEVNHQADLVFEFMAPNTTIQVDLFAAYLTDFILSEIDPELTPRLPQSPGVRLFTNIDEVFKTGAELSWTQRLSKGLQQKVQLAYTYGQDLERREPLPEIAPLDFRYHILGSFLNDKLRPDATFRYVMRQERISREYGETVTPSFITVDTKISYRFFQHIRVAVGVENLLDANYYEHLNRSVRGGMQRPIFAPGRNIFASFTIDFP